MQPLSGNQHRDFLTCLIHVISCVSCMAPATQNAFGSLLTRCRVHCACHGSKTTLERPKVILTSAVFSILTLKQASRHNCVHFFDISTSKSGPTQRWFYHFSLETCFAPQGQIFLHLDFQKRSGSEVFLGILTSACASGHNAVHFLNISTCKGGPTCGAFTVLISKCAERRNAVHVLNIFQKCSGPFPF